MAFRGQLEKKDKQLGTSPGLKSCKISVKTRNGDLHPESGVRGAKKPCGRKKKGFKNKESRIDQRKSAGGKGNWGVKKKREGGD